MILTLTVLRGQASVERVEVTIGRSTVLIGRGATCDVRVDDSYVSETHAAVYLDAAGGRMLAQCAETCVVYGMPRAVVEGGAALAALAPASIGEALNTLQVQPDRELRKSA